jgi:hypothetical protein
MNLVHTLLRLELVNEIHFTRLSGTSMQRRWSGYPVHGAGSPWRTYIFAAAVWSRRGRYYTAADDRSAQRAVEVAGW